MNELRMYVEHLFEGKVLSADVIELKEEVYGNLVARYEDYLAQGMATEEALSSTKASLTSIDDLLEDGASAQAEAGIDDGTSSDAGSEADGFAGGESDDFVAPVACDDASTSETQALDPAVTVVAPTAGLPLPPTGAPSDAAAAGDEAAATKPAASMKWAAVALAIFAAFVVLGLVCRACTGFVLYEDVDADEATSSVSTDGGNGGSVQAGPGEGVAASQGDDVVKVDENGVVTFEGQVADEVVASVVNATPEDIAAYANVELSDAASVEAMVRALPMAGWSHDVDVTRGVDVLSLSYREVPDTLEDDSVDIALAYNVAAIFCAMPKVNELRVVVTESDEPNEESCYTFTRDKVQGSYGCMLSPDMMNASGWQQLKEGHLYGRKFAEHLVEAAERL